MKSNSLGKSSITSAIAGVLSLIFLTCANAAEADISKTLKGVENHYNTAQSLTVNFAESYTAQGHKRTEKGLLYLRKPGKMRWQYTDPAGKLVVSDGKFLYFLDNNRAEKLALKETEDMKAPLAFLLGRLHFEDDFNQITTSPDPRTDNLFIVAIPKSDKLPYTKVTFLVSPDSVIHWLSVIGQDGSNLEYVFENEKKNAPVQESMFRFVPPPGVEYVTPIDNKR
ncbi:MAG TPA: outer membrane lipoprotein chaperone LolA [Bryobacteraceae bacterium]|nr:outer membrane lipoprotein chaperone LolA [Bryobacteraceae bacterium]